MEKISLLKLYLIFVKIGAILLGGGYVILPIATREFVEKRSFIGNEELLNYFTISQSLPGIIAANLSMFIGYKLRKKTGALLAMLGVITAPFLIIIALASILNQLTNNSYIKSIFWGVEIAVIALIILTIREILQNTTKNIFFYFIFSITLIALLFINVTPIQAILFLTPIGVIIKLILKDKEAK